MVRVDFCVRGFGLGRLGKSVSMGKVGQTSFGSVPKILPIVILSRDSPRHAHLHVNPGLRSTVQAAREGPGPSLTSKHA